MTSLIPSPSIVLIDNRPAVSSLKIAEHFGKQHAHVMRDIRRIISEAPEGFSQSNFGSVKYTDAKGEERDAFNVFQDGFVLLVMGYTGAKAMRIKIAYIMAFNAMRDELAAKPRRARKALPPAEPVDYNKDYRRIHEDLALACKILDGIVWRAQIFMPQGGPLSQKLILEQVFLHSRHCHAAIRTALEEYKEANRYALMIKHNDIEPGMIPLVGSAR
jgi:Rha family phage regulatory protein